MLDTPLADNRQRDEMADRVCCMVVWRWMLVPVLVVDGVAWTVAALAVSRQRNDGLMREFGLEM